jgi:hypothetical protein
VFYGLPPPLPSSGLGSSFSRCAPAATIAKARNMRNGGRCYPAESISDSVMAARDWFPTAAPRGK